MTLISTVGGAGGPLYGTLFLQAGMKTAGKMELTLADWTEALEAASTALSCEARLNWAIRPWSMRSHLPLTHSNRLFRKTSQSTRRSNFQQMRPKKVWKATIPLVARKGRASYLGERSAGHQDPGATSSYLMLKVAAETGKTISDIQLHLT